MSEFLSNLSFTDRFLLEKTFEEADKNQDGFIDFLEMKLVLMKNNVMSDDETLKYIFNIFDKNSDGKLNMEEYVKMYIYVREKISEEK